MIANQSAALVIIDDCGVARALASVISNHFAHSRRRPIRSVVATGSRDFFMAYLSIGELARRTGVNIETIRYFEKVGLIDKPSRTEGGHRVYREQHVRALT